MDGITRTRLAAIGAGSETKDAWYYNISLIEADDAQLAAALAAAQGLVEALVPAVTFADLTPKLEATFSRNDHNVGRGTCRRCLPFKGETFEGG